MNKQTEIQKLEKRLQDNMSQEIRLLRNMLTSIQEEQRAILTCNLGSWEQVIERRLFPAEKFQQLNTLILESIKSLHLILDKPFPNDEMINHETALELLVEICGVENCEIIFLKNQILVLLQEIHQQNRLSAYFLHQHPITHFPRGKHIEQAMIPYSSKQQKAKQNKLLLMDPQE